jgi:hypothetical protein
MAPTSVTTPSHGASFSHVAVTQPTKPTNGRIDRSNSLLVITNICAMVASTIGIAMFNNRLKPK